MSVTFTAYNPTTEEFVSDSEELEVNVSNANAATLLEVLGLDTIELMGAESAEGFLGRVLMASAVSPEDAGIPAHVAVGNPRWIEGGRRPGYIQERLEQLRTLAEFARSGQAQITWA